ncbi:DNA-binding MarR family transcriptional regulator [Brevundimonas alba]|uniref:DNA-binding MarR family transcriptional regulator n=1 Tax=Brevundimonas alba TaxID=74314 RepID=A0A7X5YKQ4_9CAUL|nr:MarR family winged helix-turn-helix transcriptional regulator [Brevundimonas alba]NJC41703.1 DNA-binding MarR family transcriptional regulator [Brevundimonas alba]
MPNFAVTPQDYPGAVPGDFRLRSMDMAAAIQIARASAPAMTLTQLAVFLTIASEEGLRLKDLCARTRESQATISRSVGLLTTTGYRGTRKSGYGLVALLGDLNDGRVRRAALTADGRRLFAEIECAFQ